MNYVNFLNRIIDDGIAAATESYKNSVPKREGAVAGFRACRGKSPTELLMLLREANQRQTILVGTEDMDAYWRARCFQAEVEWTCNVVSAALQNMGESTIVTPTARGYMKAAEILGVGDNLQLN